MKKYHLARKDLLLYVDAELPVDERRLIETHLAACPSCANVAAGMVRVGKAVRNIPVEGTSAGFTATVLHELGLASSSRRRFRLLESAGALVAMVVVAGVLLSVFLATGVLKEEQVTATQSVAGLVLGMGRDAFVAGMNTISGTMASYLTFDFGKNAVEISLSALVVLALLAIVDRFAGRRVLHRME
jgi:predicted anti-sigma-YlaC factor YlaD